jgi:hypothetical protein
MVVRGMKIWGNKGWQRQKRNKEEEERVKGTE